MNIFEFGQLSFNYPYSEMTIILSIAAKEEYESLLDFVYDAVRKSWCCCETDTFTKEQLDKIHLKPAAENARKQISSFICYMNQKIDIRLEEMQSGCSQKLVVVGGCDGARYRLPWLRLSVVDYAFACICRNG